MEEFREGAILLTVLRNRGRVQEEVQGKILGQWGVHASDNHGTYQITETTTGFYVHGDMSEDDAMVLAKRFYAIGPVPVSVSDKGKTVFEDREQRKALIEIMKQFDKERRGSEVIGDEDE